MLRIFVFLHKILLSQRKSFLCTSISEVFQKSGFRFLSFLYDDRGEGEHGEMKSLGYNWKFIAALSAEW